MKRGDLQKLLREYGEHYIAYSSLGANPPDPLLHKEHAAARIAEYDAMKQIENELFRRLNPEPAKVVQPEAGGYGEERTG